jgi:hypothetical protein
MNEQATGMRHTPTTNCITGSKARKGAQSEMSDSANALVSSVLTTEFSTDAPTAASQNARGGSAATKRSLSASGDSRSPLYRHHAAGDAENAFNSFNFSTFNFNLNTCCILHRVILLAGPRARAQRRGAQGRPVGAAGLGPRAARAAWAGWTPIAKTPWISVAMPTWSAERRRQRPAGRAPPGQAGARMGPSLGACGAGRGTRAGRSRTCCAEPTLCCESILRNAPTSAFPTSARHATASPRM